MPKPFTFSEFDNVSATVQSPTIVIDDMMGESDTWTTKTSVGNNGVITGSFQAITGQRQDDLQAKFAQVVDYIFYPSAGQTNLSTVINGDRLQVSGKSYDLLYADDETGAGLAPLLYLRRID